MKKILLSMLSLVALAVNAQTEFTWTSEDWGCEVGTNEKGNITWTAPDPIEFSKDGFTMSSAKGSASTAPTVAANATPNDARIYAKGELVVSNKVNITGLEFVVSTQGKKRLAEISASVGDVTVDAQNWKVYWVGNASSVTFTVGEKAKYGTEGATKAGQFDFESVKLYVGGAQPTITGGELEASGLAYSQGSKTVTLGTEYELPTLSNPNNLSVTYSSSNEDVATVDANGDVAIIAAGTCTITAKSEATDKYLAGKASYSLTVKEAEQPDVPQDEVSLPYNEPFSSGIGSFTIDDVNLGEGLTYVWKHDSGNKYMKASAYANKANIPSESWLVSPVINLGSAVKPTIEFQHCINKYFGNVSDEATLWIKEDGGSWNQLSIASYGEFPDGKNWTSMTDQSVDITSYAGKKVVVGFKYVSTSDAAGTWEVKKFSVTDGGTASSINAVSATTVDAAAYNLAGQRVNNNYKGAVIKNGKKFMVK